MDFQNFVKILLPNFLARFVSIFANMDRIWYNSLRKSPLTPPGYIFGLVWPILYLSLGYVLANLQIDNPASIFLYLNLFLNLSWIYVYNSLRSLQGGFLIIILMILTLVGFFYSNPQVNLSYILFPYFLWLVFACYLAYYIYKNNPQS